MECSVCGKESNKYVLCKDCNKKRETGEIVKCNKCGKWHYAGIPCWEKSGTTVNVESGYANLQPEQFLYNKRKSLITPAEKTYYDCIRTVLPQNYLIHVQSNLASFIVKLDHSKFQNELFRNVDFLITDLDFKPQFVIEINDRSHLKSDRQIRDTKVLHICEEAGIPILTLWVQDTINLNSISEKIFAILNSLPVQRVKHFDKNKGAVQNDTFQVDTPETKNSDTSIWAGCYIATCVYGSYDCPSVYTLRRFRDMSLSNSILGRFFIKFYYKLSPTIVRLFGKNKLFKRLCKFALDICVAKLQESGYSNSYYKDEKKVK